MIICALNFSGGRAAIYMGLQQQQPVRQYRSFFLATYFSIEISITKQQSHFILCSPLPTITFVCFPHLLDLWGYSSKMPNASHAIGTSALRSPAKPARVICKFNLEGGGTSESANIIQVAIGLWQSCHIVNYTDNNKNNSRDRCPVVPISRWQ